jgi:hypothetical protein
MSSVPNNAEQLEILENVSEAAECGDTWAITESVPQKTVNHCEWMLKQGWLFFDEEFGGYGWTDAGVARYAELEGGR